MDKSHIINYLGIIPARSGSVGIKNKNIYKIKDKELFRYTLEPAVQSKIDKIFFSTDSELYLSLYKKYFDKNKDVTDNYIRPSNISGSGSLFEEYIKDCLAYLNTKNYTVLNIVILQPTSLFRTPIQINDIIDLHQQCNNNIKSVSTTLQDPYNMMYENKDMVIEHSYRNRQEYKPTYILNGAYFIFSVENFNNNNIKKYDIYKMSTLEGFDLDNEAELYIIKKIL